MLFATDAKTFREQNFLSEEVFGPSTLLVGCGSPEELEQIARGLHGQLTASVHGTDEDLATHKNLIAMLLARCLMEVHLHQIGWERMKSTLAVSIFWSAPA